MEFSPRRSSKTHAKCCVSGCGALSSKRRTLSFHKFPKNVVIRQKWVDNLNAGSNIKSHNLVCSLHFSEDSYNFVYVHSGGEGRSKRTLKLKSVPSLNLPVKKTFKEVQEYLTDIAENDRPTSPKLSKLEEVVINENIVNLPAESLYSDIHIVKHELDCDPLASTSSAASTCLFGINDIKKEIETEESVTPENGIPPVIKIVKLAKKLTTENDPEMLFCLSLHPSLQRVPERYRNKAKIDILQVIDKYVTTN